MASTKSELPKSPRHKTQQPKIHRRKIHLVVIFVFFRFASIAVISISFCSCFAIALSVTNLFSSVNSRHLSPASPDLLSSFVYPISHMLFSFTTSRALSSSSSCNLASSHDFCSCFPS
ncbi:hypothetical protein M758_UG305600 [Ceratodon purpureus]|nr:hypothetical protein M758_UG305600 [Ceratodon purpureus]